MSKYARSSFLIIALFFSLGGLALNTEPERVSAAHRLHPEVTPTPPRVQTIQFKSVLLGQTLPYTVVLPLRYYPSPFVLSGTPNRRMIHYPVLYLLHGAYAHYDQFTTMTKLSDYAAAYQIIVVMPEGNFGWYTDSATIPKDKYESYVLEELIPDVEQRFRALRTRRGRSIAGLSMGGYGALKFGVKHPEKFVFAGSMSGALGPASATQQDVPDTTVWNSISNAFGPVGSPTRAANDLYKLYGELPPERVADLPYVYLDCGTEDGFLPLSRIFADLLQNRKIPHEYRELPGNHNGAYWDKQVQEVLRIADRIMHEP